MAPRPMMPPRASRRHSLSMLAVLVLVLLAILPGRSLASVTTADLSTLTVSPEAVPGGRSATGTVTLSVAAPPGGATLATSTSNPNIAWTTGSVTVPEGATSATFAIETNRVNQNAFVKVYVEDGTVSRSASLGILAPVVGLAFNPESVVGGHSVTGTVVLAEPAPAGGALVVLDSGNPTLVQTPDGVMVPEGELTTTFVATTTPVSASSGARVAAGYNGGFAWGSLMVMPPSLTTLTLEPSTVKAGTTAAGIVTLDGPAPTGGFSVGLSSTDASVASVPTSVVVPEGARSATFTITTGNVTQTTLATVTATAGAISKNQTLAVAPVVLIGLSLNPATVVGGKTATGTVTIDSPAPVGGIVVAVSSSAPKIASVPATVTIPAGATSASFLVTTTRVRRSTSVVISGAYNSIGATATLTVTKR